VQKPDESDEDFQRRLESFKELNRNRVSRCRAKKKKKSADQKKELRERIDRIENIVSIHISDQRVMNKLREEFDGVRKLDSVIDTTTHQVATRDVTEHRANDQESEREVELEEPREELDDQRNRVDILDTSKDQEKRIERLEKAVSVLNSNQQVMERDISRTNRQLVETNTVLNSNLQVKKRDVSAVEHRASDQESEREVETEEDLDLSNSLLLCDSNFQGHNQNLVQAQPRTIIDPSLSTRPFGNPPLITGLRVPKSFSAPDLRSERQLQLQHDFMRGERAADRQLFVAMQTQQNESFKAGCTALQTALQSSLQSGCTALQSMFATATTQQNSSYRAFIEGRPSALPPTNNQVGNQVDVNQQVSFSDNTDEIRFSDQAN